MKTIRRTLSFLLLLFAAAFFVPAQGQSVLDPDDPIVVYNPSSPPAGVPYDQISKWVKTNRLNWTTSSYKAYIYKGNAFRLKFPKTYDKNANDGKVYPMIVFFHGRGEAGTIYDNEYQMYHGGQQFRDKVDNGTFDGYILFMQTTNGYWGTAQYDAIKEIIDYMIVNNKLDPFQVVDNGLSSGGAGTWDMTIRHPTYISAMLPMSMSSTAYQQSSVVNSLKYMPIWIFQGGLDGNPDPYTTQQVRNAFLNAGGNFKYTEYPNLGHGTWNTAWAEPDFYPYVKRSYGSNPWTLFGRTEFCPGDPINVTIGLTPGFQAYQWRKDGVVIGGATGNTINVTTLGVYDARVQRNGVWSEWSRTPVEIKIKAPTVSPNISISGLQSKVIPAPDGSTGVTLEVPAGYASYQWQKEGNGATLGTQRTYTATSSGEYKVRVTEEFGCSSDFSPLFTVVDANGPNKPDPAANLVVTTVSKTSLRLDWSDNPTPVNDENNFEVYQGSQAGGPYELVHIGNANTLTYTVEGLGSGTKYYYIVRAVNGTGAASNSNEANGTTAADTNPPTAPQNLAISGSTRSSVSLSWSAASDDVGVTKYDVYVDGVKSYVTESTQFTVYNLVNGQTYRFAVKARDFAGNQSPFSNQVTGQALLNGLPYKHYTFTGTWNNLPDFGTLTPVATGVMPNVALTPRVQNDNFAFLWEGQIIIPQSGTYYFRTNSDDGSRLWLGALNGSASPYNFSSGWIVNNDGLHGSQNRTSSAMNLTAGVYPIAIAFYEQGGGESMTVSWRTPSTGTSYVTIPNSAFADAPVVNGSAPSAPSGLSATAISYSQVNLSWTDNSSNETGFEIWRSTNATSGFVTVGNAGANGTSFEDKDLQAGTTYYYKIRSIGQYGESALIPGGNPTQANWKLNNNTTDASGNGRTITLNNGPTYSTDRQEGSHSIDLDGSNDDITVNTSSGDYLRGGYSDKTVAFWMRSDVTNSNRGIFDFGGSDDGLAMRLNANQIVAGVASNNTRRSISATYNNTNWNHVALVYSGNTLRMYVNGSQVASNTNLGFSSVGTTTDASMIGDDNGANALNTTFGQFDGHFDDFYVIESALDATQVQSLMNGTLSFDVMATTLAAPPTPADPGGLSASGVSNSRIDVSWTDNANNETGYELYRSNTEGGNYILLSSLPANTVSYSDAGLFANAIHYYKVRALGEVNNSGYSNTDSGRTVNNVPVITPIAHKYMRYGTQLEVVVLSSDLDPETLTVEVTNLPSFGSYTPGGNGTGTILFNNPSVGQQGTYSGITVTVTDQNGGSSQVVFDLTVNDNYLPELGVVSDVALNEQQSTQLNLSASDQNGGDVLSWSFTGLPGFVNVVTNGGSATLTLTPGLSDHGVYAVTAVVNDGSGGEATRSFLITVNDVNPNQKIYINFTDGTYQSPAPWNNTNKGTPSLNDNFANLLYESGSNSGVGIQVTSNWQNLGNATNTFGVNTGNNSGVYPDNVIRSAYFTTTVTQTMRIYGLNTNYKYNFTFFGSRGSVGDDRTTVYTIGAQSVSLNAANNSQNTVSITNVTPQPDGSLVLSLARGGSSAYGYLNAMVIEALYDDGTAPAPARDLSASVGSGGVSLSWVDAAYNESGYEVYRSLNAGSGFAQIGTTPANASSFTDPNVLGNTAYYYYVRSVNAIGGNNSDTILITTPNTAPLLAVIGDVSMETSQVLNVNVSATDEPGDVITLTAQNLPSFASFTDNGNGTGVVHLAPGSSSGVFTGLQITATDNTGASSSRTFNVTVAQAGLKRILVNFNATLSEPLPWNSFNSIPLANTTLTDLKDELGVSTGANITLVSAWENGNDLGATTGNNSGVYPDNVMKTAYYEGSTSVKTVRLSGLSIDNKYNLIFFGSRSGVNDNRTTVYTAGGQSVSLNAASNTSNTVQISNLAPNASGIIDITIQKGAGSVYAYLNALEIQVYADGGGAPVLLAPTNLKGYGLTQTSIGLNWTDKSSDETGFEVYRSNSVDGAYNLVGTTGANVTSFTNISLAAGVTYFYKVRAIKGATASGYTNIVSVTSVGSAVKINFNTENPAATPWNNTNNPPLADYTYFNLTDTLSNPTGMNLTVMDANFAGVNLFGMNTGNNSGVVPDNVMRSTWWLDVGATAVLRVDGLNQAKSYSFVFFASRDLSGGFDDRTTRYTINGQSVSLNAANNVNNTVQLNNVQPDENGAVFININAGGASAYAYIGGLIVNAYTSDDLGVNGQGGTGEDGRAGGGASATPRTGTSNDPFTGNVGTEEKNPVTDNRRTEPVVIPGDNTIGAYPNPFAGELTLKLSLAEASSKVSIRIVDVSGRLVYSKELGSVAQGETLYRLNLESIKTKPGIYILSVYGLPNGQVKAVRLIKAN